METMSLGLAQKVIEGAIAKVSKDCDRPVCVSVCDRFGFQIAFVRMDGAPVRCIDISRRKAYTAVWMGMPTDEFLARLQKDHVEARDFGDEMLCALPGGNLLKNAADRVIGAVGISGLAPSEDQSTANAMTDWIKTQNF
jgi:uncharacterized protein GlcG (DUF336 family)